MWTLLQGQRQQHKTVDSAAITLLHEDLRMGHLLNSCAMKTSLHSTVNMSLNLLSWQTEIIKEFLIVGLTTSGLVLSG